jgi:putative iron-regulated protein
MAYERSVSSISFSALVALAGLSACKQPKPSDDERSGDVLDAYAELVAANYGDAAQGADDLSTAVDGFLDAPSAGSLNQLKAAYLAAREPFIVSEAYRFYGGPIDAVWGQVNAWRMTPAFVDYTTLQGSVGIINDEATYPTIDEDLLVAVNMVEEPRDVAAGFHVIEFLIWGEDISAVEPGQRPFEDYTSNLNHARRSKYLRVAAQLLAADLADVADAWGEGGSYRAEFGAGDPQAALADILLGLRTLAEVELASRLLDSGMDWEPGADAPPDELSAYNDRTLIDLEGAIVSMRNVYTGVYGDLDGPALEDLVVAQDPDLDQQVQDQFQAVLDRVAAVPEPYETAVFTSDETRETVDDVRDSLRALDALFEQVATTLGLSVDHAEEGEDTGEADGTGTSGTDDGGTIFLPSPDMG